jgi:hypothetical protein
MTTLWECTRILAMLMVELVFIFWIYVGKDVRGKVACGYLTPAITKKRASGHASCSFGQ